MTEHLARRAAQSLALVLLALSLGAVVADPPDAPPPGSTAAPPGTVRDALAKLNQADYDAALAILEPLTQREPANSEAWLLLGLAYHAKGNLRRALPAHIKAAEFEDTAPQAMFNTACAYALIDERDAAFKWLERLRDSGRFDMTQVLADPDLAGLQSDRRFAALLPSSKQFAKPFVEPTIKIVHEWAGESAGDQFGWMARNVGDVDGDSIADVATSAPSKDVEGARAGRVYVHSGKSGKERWTRSGKPGEQLGLSLAAAGDADGDGTPDVIAGAPGIDTAHVLAGRDGRVVLTLAGPEKGEGFGRSVAGIGDFNGDGKGDLLVGAPFNDAAGEDAGRAYVFSGKDGALLQSLRGERAGDRFGSAIGGSRGATTALLVVGAPGGGPEHHGRVYVYRGGQPEPRFTLESDATGADLGGMFVSVVGDVDADGTPDVYAADASNSAKGGSTGRAYVHSGADGSRLLTLTGEAPGDRFGIGIAAAGDANGDGHDDLIVGAFGHSGGGPAAGKSYLYSGKTGELLRTYTCRVVGEAFGFDATGLGDVDGDGSLDLLISSAWSAIRGYRSGRVFVLSSGVARP